MNWWLVGSAALAVRGLKIVPHDIDLCTDDASAHTLGILLGDCLIEPVQDVRGWVSNWFGRAFLHARIEWVGGVDENLDEDEVSDLVRKQHLAKKRSPGTDIRSRFHRSIYNSW
jgi:hypothetical protein